MKHSPIIFLGVILLLTGCLNLHKKEELVRIGFSQCTSDDDWRKTMNEEIMREVSFYPDYNIDIIFRDGKNNSKLQSQQIKELVKHNIDILIVSPKEAEPLTPVLEEIYEMGIPVIVIDRKIASSKFTSFVGADNSNIGQEAGKYAAELLNGKGKILEIMGLSSSTPAIERSSGFRNILNQYPEIQVIGNFDGRWLESFVMANKDSLKTLLRGVDLVYAHNDPMAKAIRAIGNEIGVAPNVIGIDGLTTPDGGVEMVMNNTIDATFLYPTGGDKAIQIAISILKNQPFQKYNYLQTFRIDKTNAQTILLQGYRILEQQQKIDLQRNEIGKLSGLIEKQNTFLILTTMVLNLLLLVIGLIVYFLYQKNKTNRKLNRQNQTIDMQKKKIIEQRDNLVQMAKVAEEATEMKFRFFTNISHEFRTALSLISLPIKKIYEEELVEEKKEELKSVWKNTERLLRLSNELLNFRKLDKNKYPVHFNRGDIALFVSEIISHFEGEAKKKEIRLQSDIPLSLHADFGKGIIDKVLVNLISNALKHAPCKGIVTITLNADNNIICLEVLDNGPGIPAAEIPFVFDRFYQVDKQNSTKGTGLGLALARELIQLHGGSIEVKSELDVGTVFTINLPQYHQTLPEAEDHLTEIPNLKVNHQIEKNYSIRILIVEDNDELRKIIAEMLSKFFSVQTAEDGTTAIEKIVQEKPSLVISDILMPKMDGIELCRQIKQNPKLFYIPVILLTAMDSEESMVKGFNIGADAYITKPFSEYLLLTRISALLKVQERIKERLNKQLDLNHVSSSNDSYKRFLDKCIVVINENIEVANLTLDFLAEKMNMSRSTLNRRIKEAAQMKAIDFLKKAKLKYAAQLLLSTDFNVNEIAWKSGFSDTKYFSQQFQSEFRSLPSKFREEFEK